MKLIKHLGWEVWVKGGLCRRCCRSLDMFYWFFIWMSQETQYDIHAATFILNLNLLNYIIMFILTPTPQMCA
jgi:hypothetical protein